MYDGIHLVVARNGVSQGASITQGRVITGQKKTGNVLQKAFPVSGLNRCAVR